MNDKNNEARLNAAGQMYKDKFGRFPLGPGTPDVDAEMMEKAVETGKEIEPPPLPDGAVY